AAFMTREHKRGPDERPGENAYAKALYGTVMPGENAYAKALDKAVLGTTAAPKVLALSGKAPPAADGWQNSVNVLYSSSAAIQSSSVSLRRIAKEPTQCLDAPGLMEDFYTNNMDWSHNGVIAIALADTVFLWNANTGNSTELFKLGEDSVVHSVRWE
ncbi:hypothetical protein KIPB_011820, partial [Kipferlia bialata]